MKLKYVPAMHTNRSTSIHTHGLVSCTQDFILHNPIDEHLNLQQIVSELQQTMSDPATKCYTITSSCNPCAWPFSQGFTTYTRSVAQHLTYVHDLYKVSLRMYVTDTTVTHICFSR
jgi:hypothetical protein